MTHWCCGDTSIFGLPVFNWSNGMHGFPQSDAEYLLGIDGLSLLLVLLTSLIIPFAFLAQRMDPRLLRD